MARFCNLQAAIDCLENDNDPSMFVSSALSIDAELSEWSSRWHSSFLYATIIAEGTTPEIFEDYWHLYPDNLVALIWNHFRCIRVLVNRIIMLRAVATNPDPDLVSKYSLVYKDQIDSPKRMIVELRAMNFVPVYRIFWTTAPTIRVTIGAPQRDARDQLLV